MCPEVPSLQPLGLVQPFTCRECHAADTSQLTLPRGLDMPRGFTLSRLLSVIGIVVVASSCDAPTELGPEHQRPNFILWGLFWCPECWRRDPTETEAIYMQEAFVYHVSGNCMNAVWPGSYDWLWGQVMTDNIGVDDDVGYMEEYDYARGYWVPEGVRYQYEGKIIHVFVETVYDQIDLAQTMMHETAHEFGEEDEGMAETLAALCVIR